MSERRATCSCGALVVVVTGEPTRISVCHCHACQARTGSVFGVQARFARDGATMSGPEKIWERVGDAGARITYHFCPTCGATVWYEMDTQPELVAVPVGAFQDASFPPPRVAVYEDRRHPWVTLPDGIERER